MTTLLSLSPIQILFSHTLSRCDYDSRVPSGCPFRAPRRLDEVSMGWYLMGGVSSICSLYPGICSYFLNLCLVIVSCSEWGFLESGGAPSPPAGLRLVEPRPSSYPVTFSCNRFPYPLFRRATLTEPQLILNQANQLTLNQSAIPSPAQSI